MTKQLMSLKAIVSRVHSEKYRVKFSEDSKEKSSSNFAYCIVLLFFSLK